MQKIDSHQHFWIYNDVRDAWITDDMEVIRRNFLPADLQQVLLQNGITGCVAVQADQSEQETDFLVGLAQNHEFIKGVVGWVDLQADNLEERLQHYASIKLIKGFRHVLQAEEGEFMLQLSFVNGVALLKQYGFTYDILVKPHQLSFVKEFVAKFPDQPFVIDHLAKPYIKDRRIDSWREDMIKIAAFPNVSCKISGMVTEADWTMWQPDDFTPYLDVVFSAFGSDRVMFGSDWPVCNLAGGYKGVMGVIDSYIDKLTENEQEMFWAKNSVKFYNLGA